MKCGKREAINKGRSRRRVGWLFVVGVDRCLRDTTLFGLGAQRVCESNNLWRDALSIVEKALDLVACCLLGAFLVTRHKGSIVRAGLHREFLEELTRFTPPALGANVLPHTIGTRALLVSRENFLLRGSGGLDNSFFVLDMAVDVLASQLVKRALVTLQLCSWLWKTKLGRDVNCLPCAARFAKVLEVHVAALSGQLLTTFKQFRIGHVACAMYKGVKQNLVVSGVGCKLKLLQPIRVWAAHAQQKILSFGKAQGKLLLTLENLRVEGGNVLTGIKNVDASNLETENCRKWLIDGGDVQLSGLAAA
eukprot:m.193767 g.193767  ORF g.193767 m.193767 type:complete len:306 (+) comp10607_c0_seq4:9965-10882(+)